MTTARPTAAHRPAPKRQAPRRQRAPKPGRHRSGGTDAPTAAEAPTGTDRCGRRRAECGNATSDVIDGDLEGFAGTTPFGKITPEFMAACARSTRALNDFNYAAETYDAVMIIGAGGAAGRRRRHRLRQEINGITRDGEKCTTSPTARTLIAAGTDIDYDGASGPLEFAGNGEPLEASYGLLQFGEQQPHRRSPDAVHHRLTAGPTPTSRRYPGRGHPRR